MESNSEQTTTFTDSVVFEIIKEFGARAEKGYNKYGTDMDRTDLSVTDWCQHLREELMDGLVYLTRLKRDISSLEEELNALRWANKEDEKEEGKGYTDEELSRGLRKVNYGTKIVYNIVPKPNETYTDEEPIVRKKYNWHR
jgi:hypothetical protein